MIFYAMGIYAATIARKTQSILGKKPSCFVARPVSQRCAEKRNHLLEILATRCPLTGLGHCRSANAPGSTGSGATEIPKA